MRTLMLPKSLPEKLFTTPDLIQVQAEVVVIVGANGSGKSRLGAWIELMGQNGSVRRIGGQRGLMIEPSIQMRTRESSESLLLYGTESAANGRHHLASNRWRNRATGGMLDDFPYLFSTLYARQNEVNDDVAEACRADANHRVPSPPEGDMKRLRRLWRAVLPGLDLEYKTGTLKVRRDGSAEHYLASELSDGERSALYLIGQVIAAPDDCIFVMDEPETHLHRAIRDRLWAVLRAERSDCLFVFITHDLEFASSVPGATRIWVEQFAVTDQGERWKWQTLPESDLPQSLVLEVLGSKKPVLVVEGSGPEALDVRVYQAIYPDCHVRAVGNWEHVRATVHGFRNLPGLHHAQVRGIIDRDVRASEETASLAGSGIAVCPYAEVENLLLDPEIIKAVLRHNGADAKDGLSRATKRALELLKESEGRQVAAIAFNEAERSFRLSGKAPNDTSGLSKLCSDVYAAVSVSDIWSRASTRVSEAISSGDLRKVLEVYNNKGLLSQISGTLHMGKEMYTGAAIARISDADSPSLREHLQSLIALPKPVGNK